MAKKITRNSRSQAKAKNKPQGGMAWLITGLLCGILLAGLFYLYQKGSFTSYDKTKLSSNPKSKQVREPQFDFYNILPNMKFADGKEEHKEENSVEKRPTPPPSTIKQTYPPTVQKTYLIQVASFLHHKDADHMKAELILDGYNVQIKKFEKGGVTWYRVMIGPFHDVDLAKDTQQKLRRERIDSLLISLKSAH